MSRANGNPLLLPAGELAGIVLHLVAQAHHFEGGNGDGPGLLRRKLFDVPEGRHDIAQRGFVQEQVEVLEHKADVGAFLSGDARFFCNQLAVAFLIADQVPLDVNPAGVDGLELVDATQQRALAGSAGAQNGDGLAAVDHKVHPFEHFHPFLHVHLAPEPLPHCGLRIRDEGLVDVADVDDRLVSHWPVPFVPALPQRARVEG
ncbi:hypothetical protein ACVWZ8_002364 [Arthrobacter sp. UYCu723]